MNITVATREQAWQEAKKLFPMEYEKDYASSVRSGHPIYTHMSSTHHCRIDELDGRLIVYIGQYDNIS
ncbi:MAG: hypothetical protein FWF32_07690, partial [Endomicrobia bacterium]|nr:hypothetical protein [Endomicrobiia bacterium]